MSLEIFNILNGIKPVLVIPRATDSKKRGRFPLDEANRATAIMEWLVKWGTSCDCIMNAFIVNGIQFDSEVYIRNIHKRVRVKLKSKDIERHWKSRKVKEMYKMGATFKEIYVMYWGNDEPEKHHRRKIINDIIDKIPKT